MSAYFTALGITIAVEYLVYLLFIRKAPFALLFYAIIINCITHPIAYYFYTVFTANSEINNSFNIYFLIIEIIVFLAEIIPLRFLLRVSYSKAAVISFTANLITASLSFLV